MVDGITAEDIGKFPDTNLAESMQRITGVSIDRVNGEGSKVSVRGIGSDYNLVLLNGRQMPGANINDTSASDSRSFDFANLASEAISAIEVHKTSSADRPTGGLGAIVNIRTTRPLDAPGRHAAFGIKGVTDRSNKNLPEKFKGSSFTPEFSGIYSNTFRGRQVRHCDLGQLPGPRRRLQPGRRGQRLSLDPRQRYRRLGHHQQRRHRQSSPMGRVPNDIYQVPQDIRYFLTGIERKRTNGQLTLQFRPVESVTATLDYTYSENKIAHQAPGNLRLVQLRSLDLELDRRQRQGTAVVRGDGQLRRHRHSATPPAAPGPDFRHGCARRRHGAIGLRDQGREQFRRLQPEVGSHRQAEFRVRRA